jgi:regulator of RNase E activity RraA
VLETLRQVSTSTIATQLYKRGFRQPQLLGVKPLSEVADGFVGEAFTMRFIPMREDVDTLDPYRSGNTLQWEAFEQVLQVPIGCAGVAVYPGDVLVGDRDGVLVIPRAVAAEVAEQGLEQEQLEAFVNRKIHAGEPLWGNYPPGEEVKAEYKASLASSPAGDEA